MSITPHETAIRSRDRHDADQHIMTDESWSPLLSCNDLHNNEGKCVVEVVFFYYNE